jgi:hypothetical protein
VRSCSFSPPVTLKMLGLYFTVQFDINLFLASFNIG